MDSMGYIKSFFCVFLTIFFSNHILPGIQVISQTKLPHLGADLMFPSVLAAINIAIYPCANLIGKELLLKRLIAAVLLINSSIYGLLYLVSIGIEIYSFWGYFSAVLIISVSGFVVNYQEVRKDKSRLKAFLNTDSLIHSESIEEKI